MERDQRRLVRRHRVMGRQGFLFAAHIEGQGEQQMALYDVAAAGISFVFPAHKAVKVGDVFSGSVHVPGSESVSVSAEVRNVRPVPGDSKNKLAGCRFSEIQPAALESLSQALAKLG